MPFWITFKDPDHKPGCIVAHKDTVEFLANQLGEVESIQSLPYAANPVIAFDEGRKGEWTLCMHGAKCAGRSSCPRIRACSE